MLPINHTFIPLSTGLTPHILTVRSPIQPPKACVIFLHGFPDTNWGWRHLLRPVAMAGYDVFAPSMRGYGPNDRQILQSDQDLAMEKICQDIDALISALSVEKAVIVGHDWGGTAAWNFSCHYPHRTLAVASFCTPFFPVPIDNPWPKMLANPGRFAYQLVFQTDEARDLMESDLERTVKVFMRASMDEGIKEEYVPFQERIMGLDLINGIERKIPVSQSSHHSGLSKMHSESDFNIYVDQFKRCGFLNPLRWYRNVERNWKWNSAKIKGKKVTMPALMVTAENDGILTPSMTKDMPKYCNDLEIAHVKQASHWIMQEQPAECAKVLCAWLAKVEKKADLTSKI